MLTKCVRSLGNGLRLVSPAQLVPCNSLALVGKIVLELDPLAFQEVAAVLRSAPRTVTPLGVDSSTLQEDSFRVRNAGSNRLQWSHAQQPARQEMSDPTSLG